MAAALRFFALGDFPPGLYHDEAFNGLDALSVLEGQRPIYFAANRGREPLFIYLIAAAVRLCGRTPAALRLAAAIGGTLTIPATYLMAREWCERRIALLSAAILTITLWHVHLSRIGFRAVTLPLATALTLWLGGRAFRSRRRRDWLLTGLLYGLSFYTYLPIRFTPLVLALFGLYLLTKGYGDRLWPGSAYLAAGTVVALIPFAIYTAGHWDVVMGRTGQVSVFNPVVNHGDLWATLGRQLLRTLGMFFVRGDTIPRHNVPGRPVFMPLLGAAMIWGIVWAVRRAREGEPAPALVLLWVGGMLAPTWLAGDAPHFLRAVGVLPMLALLPAFGLDRAMDWLEERGRPRLARALIGAVLVLSLGSTSYDYFVRYSTPETAYAFEEAATELAAEVNRFTGVGWDGAGMRASTTRPQPGRRVYLDERLWQAWAAVDFLVPESESLMRFPAHKPPTIAPNEEALLLIWPYDGVQPYLERLPRDLRVEAHAGPLTRGDWEEEPYAAYVAYAIKPKGPESAERLAIFGGRIALLDCTVKPEAERWKVELTWEALAAPERNYTAFVCLCDGVCEGDRLVAQDDGEPGDGYYPTSLWRAGDAVIDSHKLELPDEWTDRPRMAVGLYTWPTLERLEVTAPSGEALGDMLILPVTYE